MRDHRARLRTLFNATGDAFRFTRIAFCRVITARLIIHTIIGDHDHDTSNVVRTGENSVRQKSIEAAIDDIVASCDDDVRGALRALLLVNEHLESELHQLYALAVHSSASKARAKKFLH